MLFRNKDGELIELNRYDCKNDNIYYKKILQLKNIKNNTPKETSYSKYLIQKVLVSNDLSNESIQN